MIQQSPIELEAAGADASDSQDGQILLLCLDVLEYDTYGRESGTVTAISEAMNGTVWMADVSMRGGIGYDARDYRITVERR
jgi:hypothetical protein